MSKAGWITLVAMGLVAGVLAGALIASGDDESDGEQPTPVTAEAPATDGPAPGNTDEETTTAPAVEPDDVPLTTGERRRVERAALVVTGGGTVSEVDRSDDPGEAYEVEVITDRGEVDVALDQDLRRVDNSRYDD